MSKRHRYWHGRYGPWALVAGASEGIGAAFATKLAHAGLNVVLVARRSEPLEELARTLRAGGVVPPEPRFAGDPSVDGVIRSTDNGALTVPFGRTRPPAVMPRVQVKTVVADLAAPGGFYAVRTATTNLEIGLVVANAAYAPIGRFLDTDQDELIQAIELNCTTTLRLAKHFLPQMAERRRGGFIIMSSLAGSQGSPGIATYAATKAFGAVLAEGLWSEMHPFGVDVLACVPGAVETPGLAQSKPKRAPGTVSADTVATTALASLGRRPRAVPGALMKVSTVLTRLLPRRTAIAVIAKASKDLT
jgi:uncharacterized protein